MNNKQGKEKKEINKVTRRKRQCNVDKNKKQGWYEKNIDKSTYEQMYKTR